MADRITLTGLRVRAHHGVFEHEKRDGQEFVADVTVWLDVPDTDDLADTVHYGELAERVAAVVGGPSRDLIETVAIEAAEDLMRWQPRLHAAEVTIHKPNAPIGLPFADVAVTIRRSRKRTG
ncbi:dihydroneopterin aldolase [Actinophytocola oryzae]|uniref:7,8-dihydroneopterin aldolase n=1 Tax=Actinophytocola oryzae TaxID=502181 RepID=A0A4R7UX88_9PSEU|nr:dihydroneopterin aldolase [Actinophytocola oryzae]TDV40707.1 dihydroneopterin aldolase [Actinophytocola oryzae]